MKPMLQHLGGGSLQHPSNVAAWKPPEPRLPQEMPTKKGIGFSLLVKMMEEGLLTL